MIFTESKKMSKAIDDAINFVFNIHFIEPTPSIKDIQALEDALLSLSPIDVQTEIMENDDPIGNLRYYLDVFRYSLHLCDISKKVIHLPYLGEEALRERLKEEGHQPTSIDRYIEQCYKLIETARGRIEDVFLIFDNIDWVQLRKYLPNDVRVNSEALLPYFKNEDALNMFLNNIKDKTGADIVHEAYSAYKCGVLNEDPRNTGEGTLHNELEGVGFKVQQPSGWRRAFDKEPRKPINNIYYKFARETD